MMGWRIPLDNPILHRALYKITLTTGIVNLLQCAQQKKSFLTTRREEPELPILVYSIFALKCLTVFCARRSLNTTFKVDV